MQFLSDEWIDALDAAARRREPTDDDPLAGVELSIEQVVANGPRWQLVISDGRLAVEASPRRHADVRLISDRDTATAIASGRRSALDAFIAGDLVLGGDTRALLTHRAALETLGDLFAEVKDATTFS